MFFGKGRIHRLPSVFRRNVTGLHLKNEKNKNVDNLAAITFPNLPKND